MADLSTLDLNLLRVFDAVARERHVTRAAQRLNLSQPAVSNALARLRAVLGDELFLRRPGGVEPTELALALAGPVAEVLDRLRDTLAAHAPFDPATSDRVFTLALSEYAEAVLAPAVLERMAKDAPGCLLAVRHADRTNWQALLDREVLVRDLTTVVPNALRVTAGAEHEVDLFLTSLREVMSA
jgi:DNA-binding transcriptional LysR family regulator